MSMLEKMAIQGIRSFGPQDTDKQMITFFNPLTLILGQNGSGKTTIIECLRYVTTNDVPPGCGKGGSFVHDPKLAGEIEVKGQIRLQFRDVGDKRVNITRSMLSTQKAKQVQFKSLEGYIQKKIGDEVATLSSKCAELNFEVTEALGVSGAVLKNVIFCHQEESCWPLGEGKQVKERFDEIFSATRYIKALENIRQIRKTLGGDIKLFKNELQYLEQNKDKAKQISLDLRNTETRMLSSRNRIKEIRTSLEPIEEKLKCLSKTEGEIHQTEIQLEKKETLLKQLDKNKRDLRGVIQNIFDGSVEELQIKINSFKVEVENMGFTLEDAKRKKSNIEHESQSYRKQQSKMNMELGRLKTLEQQNKERIRKRDEKIASAADELKIPGYVSDVREPFTDRQVSAFMKEVQEKTDQLLGDFQNRKAKLDKQESELQSQMDNLRDTRTQGEQKLRMNNDRLIKNKNEIDTITRELRRVDNSAHRQRELEANLKDLELEQEKLEKTVDVESLRNSIAELQKRKNTLSSQLNLLNQEMSKLQMESEKRTKLELLEKDKISKEDIIRKISFRHEDTLKNLLGAVPVRNAHEELRIFSRKMVMETKTIENQIVQMKTKLSALETRRTHQMEELKKSENQLSSHQERIYHICGSGDFDDSMKALQKTLQELQDEKGALIGSEFIYGKYVEKLEAPKPCCPLCQRGFPEDNEVMELKRHIRRKIEMVPEQLRIKERHIAEQQKKLHSMLGLEPLRDEIKMLSETSIPSMKQKLRAVNEDLEKLRKEISEEEDIVEMKQLDSASCESILPDMILLDQHRSELDTVNRQFNALNTELNASGDRRSMAQVNQEREDAQNEFQKIMKDVELKQEQLSCHNEKVNSLHSVINSKRTELLQITADQQKRQSLVEQGKKLSSENEDLNKAIQESKELLKLNETKWQAVKSEKDQFIYKKDLELSDIQNQIEKYKNHNQNVDQYTKEIQRYVKEGQREILGQLEEKLTSLKIKIEEKEEAHQLASKTIQTLQKEIANQEVKQRELLDNMKLKECDANIAAVQRECQELQQQLGNIDTSNLFKEKTELTKEHNSLTKEKMQAEGRMQEIQNKIEQCKKDLNSDQFKDADTKYKNRLIDLKTREYASDDLNKFYMALDTAVMKFHSMKMDEINKIIRDLWMKTYKGHDIEYIEIRSDHAESGSDKRRSYNYRVVMICGESELDMRGRCSAGQKVLASLIIRLALAETFCLKCGILALDEPTTNLDRDNIESLAYALIEVVKSRAGQRNFQLVVITHDEDFINLLGRAHFCDYFYKVSKDANACTRLQKCLMSELNG